MSLQDLVSTAQKLKPSAAASLKRSGSLPKASVGHRIFGARSPTPRSGSPSLNGSPRP
jgi:hypothetical protein